MELMALCAGCWRELALARCPRAPRDGTLAWHCPHCGLVIATLDRGVIRPYARARITTSGQDKIPGPRSIALNMRRARPAVKSEEEPGAGRSYPL